MAGNTTDPGYPDSIEKDFSASGFFTIGEGPCGGQPFVKTFDDMDWYGIETGFLFSDFNSNTWDSWRVNWTLFERSSFVIPGSQEAD